MARYADDDDEVEIIAEKSFNARKRDFFLCQMCGEDLANLTIVQRQDHYEGHLSPNAGFESREPRRNSYRPSLKRKSKDNHNKWKMRFPCAEDDVFWYPALAGSPPPNSTPGLVSLMRKALFKSHSRGFTQRAALCHESTVHIRRDVWDSNWGCGYRNYLMICSALLCQQARPEYHHMIINGSRRPGVRSLQQLIQEAWEAGFDQEGQQELKHLVGTSKWIGTSDLYVAFSYCGIPCELMEFNLEESQDKPFDSLTDWIINYFTPESQPNDVNEALRGASPVVTTECMPLVLQHQGHSRTVVGYEISKDGRSNLLVFDPSLLYSQTSHVNNRLRNAAMESLHQADSPKRPISDCAGSSAYAHSTKRPRSAIHANEFIEIDSDDGFTKQVGKRIRGGTNNLQKLLPSEEKLSQRLLGACRLSLGELSKQKRYQILFFPMTPPLSNGEKAARMVVTSTMAS